MKKMENYDPDFQIEYVVPFDNGQFGNPNDVWIATALSVDHKPDWKDERKWIEKKNGRVEPFRESSGEPIGPARVWMKTENVPGLAMSRSMGDIVAQSVGVIPDPGKFFYIQNSLSWISIQKTNSSY